MALSPHRLTAQMADVPPVIVTAASDVANVDPLMAYVPLPIRSAESKPPVSDASDPRAHTAHASSVAMDDDECSSGQKSAQRSENAVKSGKRHDDRGLAASSTSSGFSSRLLQASSIAEKRKDEELDSETLGRALAETACLLRRKLELKEELMAPLRHEEAELAAECEELEGQLNELKLKKPRMESAVQMLEIFDKIVQPIQHEILPSSVANMSHDQTVVYHFLKDISSRRSVPSERAPRHAMPSWKP
eukprot:GEMP01012069.1.p1 GENE.GEMP01012069.1~~GEMP01012069.1.p1  ORF type:complete len:248 (+),score=50.35 GEMP01012069.1:1309-2052(+)